jgi:hypothetical protein
MPKHSHNLKFSALALGMALAAAMTATFEQAAAQESITWQSTVVPTTEKRGNKIVRASRAPIANAESSTSQEFDKTSSNAGGRATRAAMDRQGQNKENVSAEATGLPTKNSLPQVNRIGEIQRERSQEGRAGESDSEAKLSQASYDSPATRRGPDLLPVHSKNTPTEKSVIELLPPSETSSPAAQPTPSQPLTFVPTDGSNDFRAPAGRQPSIQQPFQFASTQKSVKLPSLPGKKSGSGTQPTATAPKTKAPGVLASADNYKLAAQPQLGDHWHDDTPVVDRRAWRSETYQSDFAPDPIDPWQPVDVWNEMQIYEGKTLNANQRPLIELGRPWYQLGQLSPGSSILGHHNNVTPQFLLFGDYRSAIASNNLGNNSTTRTAVEANLDFDLKLTGTERFHMFMSPLDDGVRNTGYLLDEDRFQSEFDANIDFGYFEGDLGALVGGAIGKTLPFDLPFTVGVIPMLLQNGIWMEDAFLGVAATLPARNSPRFDISNMDITFFAGFDQITTPANAGDDSRYKMYGMASFIEANNGYWEIDYAFLEDRTGSDLSYHNIGIGFSRRYGRLISNSTRVIANAGQSGGLDTADGVLLLSENSLITGAPSTVVPYFNFFAGFGRPQSAARAAVAGGVLRNTGILFESDGMTGYPTLDDTANETFGMALGLNLMPNDFSQQLVVETAMLGVMGDGVNRNAAGDQYGLAVRYQLPLTNAIIFRSDAMVGFRRNAEDINGVRMELRHKF